MLNSLRDYFLGPRGVAYTAFLLVGIFLLSWFLPQVLRTTSGTPNPIHSQMVAIGTSLFIVGLVEVLSKLLATWRAGRDLPLFREFFGSGAVSEHGYPTVFLQAELPSWPADNDRKPAANLRLSDPPDEAGTTLPKGIGHVIVFEDLEAVLDIDRLFRKFSGKLDMRLDTFRRNPLPDGGCLAIGLGYNNVTLRLMHLSNGLFDVIYDGNSDDFVLGRRTDPDCVRASLESCDDYALIARIVLGNAATPTPYIVCAGHTAGATVVACKYLARSWKELAERYRTETRNSPKGLREYSMGALLCYRHRTIEKPKVEAVRFKPIE